MGCKKLSIIPNWTVSYTTQVSKTLTEAYVTTILYCIIDSMRSHYKNWGIYFPLSKGTIYSIQKLKIRTLTGYQRKVIEYTPTILPNKKRGEEEKSKLEMVKDRLR